MALVGIANENEFYSAHYLDAILKEDLKQVAQRWKNAEETEDKTPDKQLGSLRQDYFKLRDRLVRTREVDEQLGLQREFLRELLGILGYEWATQLKLVADDQCLPIVAEVKRTNGQPQLWVVEGFNPSHEGVLEPVDVISLELEAARVTYPAGTGREIAIAARLHAGAVPITISGGIGTTLADDHNILRIQGATGAIRLRDWSLAERLAPDGTWQPAPDALPNERMRPMTLAGQLDKLAALTRGESVDLATLQEALAVQEIVEGILAS